jgi:hypothetical protein
MCGTILGGFVSGAVGWFASAFLTGPLRKFFDLRGEVVRQMARFANALPRWRELPKDPSKLERADPQPSKEDEARLDEAKKTCATTCCVGLSILRYDPVDAAKGLFDLSNYFDRSGNTKHSSRTTIEKALRFRDI